MHPQKTPVPLANAKQPLKCEGKHKTWKDSVYIYTKTHTQTTYCSIAPFVFPAAGQLPETGIETSWRNVFLQDF